MEGIGGNFAPFRRYLYNIRSHFTVNHRLTRLLLTAVTELLLEPEGQRDLGVGLDVGVFKNRITLEGTAYYNEKANKSYTS